MPIHQLEGMPLHTRALTITVSLGSDALWHARGEIIDLRKNGIAPWRHGFDPPGIVHSMNIELDFDPESLRIEHIAVDQPVVAIEASATSGGECCRDPAPRLLDFKDDLLDADFTRRLSDHLGGPRGCSHLLTLFQLMASAIPHGVELESSHEWKIFATVERKRFEIEALSATERRQTFQTLDTTEWIDHGNRVLPLLQKPVVPGLAGRIFTVFSPRTPLEPLRDAFLQLAPGFLQVLAALTNETPMDQVLTQNEAGGQNLENAGSESDVGACYMWRKNGGVAKAIQRTESSVID